MEVGYEMPMAGSSQTSDEAENIVMVQTQRVGIIVPYFPNDVYWL